jgi:glyoxylase-like metal-dependent hydrolase (beta-lactamase superfamily II)
MIEQVAENILLLDGTPRYMVNIYLAGDVLIDAGARWDARRVFRQLDGRSLSMVALTHVHPDHQGTAHLVCETFDVPLAVHEADVAAMEGRGPMMANDNAATRLMMPLISGKPHPVERVLHEGDEVAGFRVAHTPGHTPGHVTYFRESDRVAIIGDVLRNISFTTLQPRLDQMPASFNADNTQVAAAARKVLELEPSVVLFGHGRPLTNMDALKQFVDSLPE